MFICYLEAKTGITTQFMDLSKKIVMLQSFIALVQQAGSGAYTCINYIIIIIIYT